MSSRNIKQTLVVFASNKRRMSAFYSATLGLVATESQASHDLLQGPGFEVVVHAIPPRWRTPVPKPLVLRQDTPFKPAFVVKNLEAVRAAAVATGGGLKPAEGAWRFRGMVVLDGHDPEGNVVQFKERDRAARR